MFLDIRNKYHCLNRSQSLIDVEWFLHSVRTHFRVRRRNQNPRSHFLKSRWGYCEEFFLLCYLICTWISSFMVMLKLDKVNIILCPLSLETVLLRKQRVKMLNAYCTILKRLMRFDMKSISIGVRNFVRTRQDVQKWSFHVVSILFSYWSI